MPATSNLVQESTSGTGTGNLTLANVFGRQSFNSAFGNGVTLNVFWYFIAHRSANEWEVGTGHMSAASTLVRDTVLFSSNANAAVNFSSGEKDVTSAFPANQILNETLLTTRGDLIRRGASAAERVALGTAGQRLRSDGTDAVWGDNVDRPASIATTSGTTHDFSNIPSWVKVILVCFDRISTNGTGNLQIQIGTGGAATTSGYLATAATASGTIVASTSGFIFVGGVLAADSYSGVMTLVNVTGNTWSCSGTVTVTGTGNRHFGGNVALAGALDFLRLMNASGNTFDAGNISIIYF